MNNFVLRLYKYKMKSVFFLLLSMIWFFLDHVILILQECNIGGLILIFSANHQFLCKSPYRNMNFYLKKCLIKYDVMAMLCPFLDEQMS